MTDGAVAPNPGGSPTPAAGVAEGVGTGAVKVVMPRLGLTMKQGRVEKWMRRDGETVSKGEPLLEVLSEKVTATVPSPADGVLRILVPAGQSVPVGTPVAALVAAAAAAAPATPSAPGAAAADATGSGAPGQWVCSTPAARRLARELGLDLAAVTGTGPDGLVTEQDVRAAHRARQEVSAKPVRPTAAPVEMAPPGAVSPGAAEREPAAPPAQAPAPPLAAPSLAATPLARAVAADLGVDLRELAGSGPGGKITREDVLRAAQDARGATQDVGGEAQGLAAPTPRQGETRVPLAGRRRVIAERMAASATQTAAVTLTVHADMTKACELREALLPRVEASHGVRLTFTDIVVRVAAAALRAFPYMNASLDGETVVQHGGVHIGVAVDTDQGLVVPVIRDADRRGLGDIAATRHRLTEAARAGTISPDDLVGGTFTVTNLGMYEIEVFSPLINLPEAAILGVGAIEDRPVAQAGQVVVRPVCTLSLVFDHRIVDGAPAARFLRWIKSALENPALLLL